MTTTRNHSAVRTTQATPEQLDACRCDTCGRVPSTRGWLYPTISQEVREVWGGITCGRCLSKHVQA